MKKDNNIAILILAAGSSSRMKAVKQLLPWKDTTFLGYTIQVAKASLAKDVYVVLGSSANKIKLECKKNSVEYIINKDWQEGMGKSIACGIEHFLQKKIHYDGVFILLCDQPFINTEYINSIIQTSKDDVLKNIFATKYAHGVGVPALFKNYYFKELSLLSKDFGAKYILKKEKSSLKEIVPNFNTKDIDTEKSYNSL